MGNRRRAGIVRTVVGAVLAGVWGVCAAASPVAAAELLGADGVITLVKKAAGAPEEPAVDPARAEVDKILADLKRFKEARSKLAGAEAVDRWLQLYDRFRKLPEEARTPSRNPLAAAKGEGLSLVALVKALPPPATWQLLKERVLERRSASGGGQDTLLPNLAHYLTNDRENLERSLAELKANVALGGDKSVTYLLRSLRANDPWQGAASGEDMVARFDQYLQSLQGERPKGRLTVQLPDLVALGGEQRAEALVLKALAIPGLSLSVPSGGETLALAKRLVTANAATLTEPQWELVTAIDDTALFEAMIRRFPAKKPGEQEAADIFQSGRGRFESFQTDEPQRRARINYVLGLIAQGRGADATVQAGLMEPEEFGSNDFERNWHSFDKLRYAAGLNRFCRELLASRPELPLWKECGLLATTDSDAAALVTIIESAAAKPNIGPETRVALRERQIDLLLAMDRVDPAIALLRETVKVSAGQPASVTMAARMRLTPVLVRLGRLLQRPELVREGEELLLAALKDPAYRTSMTGLMSESIQGAESALGGMVADVLEAGDYAVAEQLVLAMMESTMRMPELSALAATKELALSSGLLSGYLTRLVEIYGRAGRYGDVLVLLEKGLGWGGTDLLDIAEGNETLSPIVARALQAAGRETEAVAVAKQHLISYPGNDPAYKVLTDIMGESALPWLETLQARDRFEERPLIWKGDLQLRQGKLDEAEKTLRQALKIDPTDGEEPPGDRGRAYSLLAKVLAAKGKSDDAAFFERVVASVRRAEQGDKFTEAGLVRRSLAIYAEAANSFADAYCIQWRLAERLSSMGEMEEARKHYEIAFTRMPEQFGQVASFCFGCEGVFTHQQSVSVAERILGGLAITSGDRPQVHYLLGQLRESQGRKVDAFKSFSRAAELDSQYLDALKAAYDLRKDVFLNRAEADRLALRMVRLDPLNRHAGVATGEIADMKGLWTIYEELGSYALPPTKSLLPLTASKASLEALVKKFGGSTDLLEMKRNLLASRRNLPEPGDAVANNGFVQTLLQVVGRESFEE